MEQNSIEKSFKGAIDSANRMCLQIIFYNKPEVERMKIVNTMAVRFSTFQSIILSDFDRNN